MDRKARWSGPCLATAYYYVGRCDEHGLQSGRSSGSLFTNTRERDVNKYMFLHYGFEKPTPEIMDAWGQWFEST